MSGALRPHCGDDPESELEPERPSSLIVWIVGAVLVFVVVLVVILA